MKTVAILLMGLCFLPAASQNPLQIPRSAAPLVIDGDARDAFWQGVPVYQLTPVEAGVPAAMGGQASVALHGGYLCILARLPEPGGKVLARSIGRNPVWEKDASWSPPVEDRLRVLLRAPSGDFSIEVNPWGAYRLEQNGQPATAPVLAAAAAGEEEWDVEIAVPPGVLNAAPAGIRLERIRSRRPLAPEFQWSWPASGTAALPPLPSAAGEAPRFAPPAIGNRSAPVEVGRVLTLPPVDAEWDDPAWKGVPSFSLPRNGATPRQPDHPTEVRWVQDGRTLAILIRSTEREPVVARAGGRDSAVASDDHVAVHLAASGSAFLEVAVNTVGAVQDALGVGPRMERPQTTWNAAGLEVYTNIRYGAWIARLNIPLQECAAALGETGVPREWRIVVSRYRAARPGEAAETSAVPAMEADSFYGPVRYRRLLLSDKPPAEVATVDTGVRPLERSGLAAALAGKDSNVWTPEYRRSHAVRTMLTSNLRRRVVREVAREREDWDRVRTKADWERYRDTRLAALRTSIGTFPPERPPLDARVTATHEGTGYRLLNLVYQTRPGMYAAANLYLPPEGGARAPVIVIQHSQHFPRVQGELHDMGEMWARKGAAVLLLERLGYGERVETTPLYRQGYASRFTFKKQLNLIGESHMAWMAWDILRAVDLLSERPDIDPKRIILIGAVAGGGEPAALAAALDPRIAAVIPYNYDQGHVRLDADYFGEIPKQISPWFVTASLAPRKYVRAFEFSWEGAEEPDYPEQWVSGWERSQKVWDLYGARDNLAGIQAFGLIRLSMERIQHCFSVGPAQRKEMFPLLEKWFQIPSAAREDAQTLPDSELTYNSVRQAAREQEAQRRRPHADLLCIPPQVAAALPRKALHEIALEMATRELAAARRQRASLAGEARIRSLRDDLRSRLGAIDPAGPVRAETFWRRTAQGADIEAVAVHVEDGIDVPLLLLRPAGASGKVPVVVATAQAGKAAFLAGSGAEIERLLGGGAAVCLPDLRGTGETSPAEERDDHSPHTSAASLEMALGNSLAGSRLKDLRAVIAYVRSRPDVDGARVAVWGASFAPPNTRALVMDEIQYQAGPEIEHHAEPGAALVALLAGLYDERLTAVAALGGLAEFTAVLRDAFTYVPMDALVPGVLKTADIPDIAAALAPRALVIAGAVDGRNVRLAPAELDGALGRVRKAYAAARSEPNLTAGAEMPGAAVVDRLLASFRN